MSPLSSDMSLAEVQPASSPDTTNRAGPHHTPSLAISLLVRIWSRVALPIMFFCSGSCNYQQAGLELTRDSVQDQGYS